MKQAITYIALVFGCLWSVQAMAQQPAQYSLYMFNKYAFNAAYAGLDESVSATGVFRSQWVGLEGNPVTQNLNVHLPMYYLKGAFGLGIENDALGAERNLKVTAAYAYQQEIGDGWLSIGARGGIIQKTLDGTKLIPRDQDATDPNIPIGIETSIAPVMDAGIFYKNDDFQVGISANNLLESTVDFALDQATNIQNLRNYFFTFAYHLDLGSKIAMKPSVLVKSDFIETQMDFTAIFEYNDNIFAGTSFRGYSQNTIDAVVILAGLEIAKNTTLAYAYDLPLSGLSATHSGSHEIMLNYNFNKVLGGPKPPKVIYNPKFL